jgi:hypothetical protein
MEQSKNLLTSRPPFGFKETSCLNKTVKTGYG